MKIYELSGCGFKEIFRNPSSTREFLYKKDAPAQIEPINIHTHTYINIHIHTYILAVSIDNFIFF